MLAYNVDEQDLLAAAELAGVGLDGPRKVGHRFRFTLRLQGERYQRRGYTGRRIAAVCWHGHYAFMAALFERVPSARIVSMAARYDGKDEFAAFADRTGDRNIGSQVQPLAYRDACDCESEEVLT